MRKNNKDHFEAIKTLIHQEEEEALRIFRESDFHSRLETRIQAQAKKITLSPLWFKKPVATLGMVLLVVCAGVIALIIIFSSSSQKSDLNALEQFFQNAPGIHTIVQNQVRGEMRSTERSREFYFFEREIKSVLFSILSAKNSRKEEITLPWDEKNPPVFDLYEKIEILIKEQKLHHFLSKYSKRYEEEKNGPKNISFHFSQYFLPESILS